MGLIQTMDSSISDENGLLTHGEEFKGVNGMFSMETLADRILLGGGEVLRLKSLNGLMVANIGRLDEPVSVVS
jgi:hypothetical protein